MKLLIIDGNNLAHRCRHVFSLSNKGEDVSTLYGFLHVLISYLRKFDPDHVLVAWDGGIPQYRIDLVPGYKAGRHTKDDPIEYKSFLSQMKKLTKILPYFGVVSVFNYGSEADDIMYAASRILDVERSIIISNDRDMLQALSPFTSIYLPSSKDGGTLIEYDEMEKYIPVKLSSYIDWRAIQGDGSDNIPGVRMVGEKTATKLFKEYGSLYSIIEAAIAGEIKGKLGDNIVEFGNERLLNNVQVMSLLKDRTGVRRAICDTLERYTPFSKSLVKKFFLQHAFVSFLDGMIYNLFSDLSVPEVKEGVRFPLICQRRKPVL